MDSLVSSIRRGIVGLDRHVRNVMAATYVEDSTVDTTTIGLAGNLYYRHALTAMLFAKSMVAAIADRKARGIFDA